MAMMCGWKILWSSRRRTRQRPLLRRSRRNYKSKMARACRGKPNSRVSRGAPDFSCEWELALLSFLVAPFLLVGLLPALLSSVLPAFGCFLLRFFVFGRTRIFALGRGRGLG